MQKKPSFDSWTSFGMSSNFARIQLQLIVESYVYVIVFVLQLIVESYHVYVIVFVVLHVFNYYQLLKAM